MSDIFNISTAKDLKLISIQGVGLIITFKNIELYIDTIKVGDILSDNNHLYKVESLEIESGLTSPPQKVLGGLRVSAYIEKGVL